MGDDSWGRVREELLQSVGKNNFVTWIEPLKLAELNGGIARIEAPTNFIGNWVSRNFGEQIRMILQKSGEDVHRLEFHVVSAAARAAAQPARAARPVSLSQSETPAEAKAAVSRAATPAPASAPEQAATAARGTTRPVPVAEIARTEMRNSVRAAVRSSDEGELPGAPLDARFTFDTFVVGKPNALAHAAARRVAEGGPVTFNPLFLYGGVGLGKTHLMHAIAHELQISRPDLRVLYLSAEQFMYRFIQALRDKQVMDFKELFRSVDVLMVDDVQFIAGKDSTQEEFFHTFNALVDQNKQIVISADRAPGEIKDLEERIKSRLQCGLVVDLHPTDYELRLGILQNKAEVYREQYNDLQLADGVLEFLAHRITTNVRVLEGALNRLFAFASLIGREITLDLAQECLTDILRASDRRVTIEEIQRRVAEHYNVRLADMVGPKRMRTIARPRQIAMYLCKHMTTRSLPEIGRGFGGRDHTTIMHGIRKIEELKAGDNQLAEDLDLLRRLLSS